MDHACGRCTGALVADRRLHRDCITRSRACRYPGDVGHDEIGRSRRGRRGRRRCWRRCRGWIGYPDLDGVLQGIGSCQKDYGTVTDGLYCGLDTAGYTKESNRERFIAVQIEDPEPMDELEEIAALPGIDMLFFGPGDFSHGIGVPGELNHPQVVEARRRMADAATRHGKFAGTVGSPGNLDDLMAEGFRFINAGSDVRGLRVYCDDIVGKFKSIEAGGR
ncbi:MAG: aldolase/citrate lyase family protein [Armatimonadota bacterium]